MMGAGSPWCAPGVRLVGRTVNAKAAWTQDVVLLRTHGSKPGSSSSVETAPAILRELVGLRTRTEAGGPGAGRAAGRSHATRRVHAWADACTRAVIATQTVSVTVRLRVIGDGPFAAVRMRGVRRGPARPRHVRPGHAKPDRWARRVDGASLEPVTTFVGRIAEAICDG